MHAFVRRWFRPIFVLPALFVAGFGLLNAALAQQSVQRDGFEGTAPQLVRAASNVPFQEEQHKITSEFAHTLPGSEYIRIRAEAGTQVNPFIHYAFNTKTAPVVDELSASVWVRSNRPGVQLLARVVLPRVRNPQRLEEPLTVVLRGETTTSGGGPWQRLEMRRALKLLKDEQQMLRAQLKADVDIGGAYVDQLLVNVYTGPGLSEVWLDDLEISPVLEPAGAERKPVVAMPTSSQRQDPSRPEPLQANPKGVGSVPVDFNRDQLRVGGHPFLFRGIRYSDTPLKALRDAGLNTLFFDENRVPSQQLLEEAVKEGFWLAPSISIEGKDIEQLPADVARYMNDEAVLFWYLGGGRSIEQLESVNRTATSIRAIDPQRPIAADVWDGFWPYSRQVDVLGVHRWPLMTGMELSQYRDWLNQKRLLARPDKFIWTWVQTHLPDWYLRVVYPQVGASGFNEPIGPQGEQIRLLTYLSLAAGCKGIAYWSDRFLADSHQGQDRLLTIALLNQELQMLEPLLLNVISAPQWIDTSVPQVKAAVIRCERGVLVLPIWLGEGSQFVPGQAAVSSLTIDVPQVPTASQAWEVTPGDVISLPAARIAGGTRVTLREFGLTSAIVFTSDNSPTGLLVRWQEQSRRMSRSAAQWSYQLAIAEIQKVETVQRQLEQLAPPIPDAPMLMANARERLQASKAAWDSGDYRQAYRESQRVLRPVRILMRAQWEQAVKPFDAPVCSPYAVSFYTLPQHWRFWKQLQNTAAGANALPEGDFERGSELPPGWQVIKNTLDDVDLTAKLSPEEPREGKQCLMLAISPKLIPTAGGSQASPNKNSSVGPVVLERTFLSIQSPPCQFPPGSIVRVSGWVKIPKAITASVDGALLYDSAGGEPLGIRLTNATKWKRFSLYRRVPSTGIVQVTLALTGVGSAYFDDVKIEPLVGKEEPPPSKPAK